MDSFRIYVPSYQSNHSSASMTVRAVDTLFLIAFEAFRMLVYFLFDFDMKKKKKGEIYQWLITYLGADLAAVEKIERIKKISPPNISG